MACKKCEENTETIRVEEQERILKLLSKFQNPIWRTHYLEKIRQLIKE